MNPITEERLIPTEKDGYWNDIRVDLQPAKHCGFMLVGDQVLVDTSAYGVPGENWCSVGWIAPGTSSPYPIRVSIPTKGIGQYAIGEVLAWSRPIESHETVMRLRALSGMPASEEGAIASIMAE